MSHHLGPPIAVAPDPAVRMERLIRVTAQLVARMLAPLPMGQRPAPEAADEPDVLVSSQSRTLRAHRAGGSS